VWSLGSRRSIYTSGFDRAQYKQRRGLQRIPKMRRGAQNVHAAA